MADENNRRFLTFEEAEGLLPDGEEIHTFMNPRGILLGCDCSRERILGLLKDCKPEISGEQARAFDHGLVVHEDGKPIFIATDPKRLAKLEAAHANTI